MFFEKFCFGQLQGPVKHSEIHKTVGEGGGSPFIN